MVLGVDQVAYRGVTGVVDLGGSRIVSEPFLRVNLGIYLE